jgi:hypothetical protein
MLKKLAVEEKNGKNQKRTHSPKSHPQNTPNTDKHTQNPKKEKRKKIQTKNKTHSANFLLFFFRIPPQIQNPERRKNNQRQAKDTQKLSKSFNWVPWICRDSDTEMVYEESRARKSGS